MVWPSVKTFQDGVDLLDAKTLNDPITQLIARTDYLKNALDSAGGRTSITIADAELSAEAGSPPALGQPVYRVAGSNAYAMAAAVAGDVEEGKWFWADQQAMAVGVVGSTPSGNSATVVLGGYVSFQDGIPVAGVISDLAPASGRYFLSATPGKLTAAPAGPIVYVCDCEIKGGKVMSMLVNPQYRDTGESHIHRAFVLSGSPVGGYSAKVDGRYLAQGIAKDGLALSATALPTGMTIVPYGHWTSSTEIEYIFTVSRKTGKSATSTDWGDYTLEWTPYADGESHAWDMSIRDNESPLVKIGDSGLYVKLYVSSGTTPASLVGSGVKWQFTMPDAAKAWINYYVGGNHAGYRLNLGMYPGMARFVPPLPANGAELTVGGIELRGAEFGDRKQWEIVQGAEEGSGPWLVWYGGEISAVSTTAPFEWDADLSLQKARDIVLHVNRMRVGPTGFVTSLQAAPGSILKVTSAQTGAVAAQGALQVGLDVNFKSQAGGAAGSEVVKRIEGGTFVTGPVVERVVGGPGVDVDRQQGTVTVSVSNAMYSGDFETIALKNAKQDLAGGVFPYTKLLRWTNGASNNVMSGFTAKFRVPDSIPYNAGKGYHVVVSASVFGEESTDIDKVAAFKLSGSMLADQACSDAIASDTGMAGSIASPVSGPGIAVLARFAGGYSAFDPILVHGFGNASGVGPGSLVLPDTDQRMRDGSMWLLASADTRMVVYPGYFVGISIERCDLPARSSATPYAPAIGFLSLRWNLVAIS